MLMSLGVKMSQIPANRKSFATKDEFVKAARKYYEGLEEEHKKGLEVIESIQSIIFTIASDNMEVVDTFLCATSTTTGQPSVQLRSNLIKAGHVCQCLNCKGKGQLRSILYDIEHYDDDARQLKAKIGKGMYSYS